MKLIAAILLALMATPILAAESYLCIADQAAGIRIDNTTKTWKSAQFSVKDKYVVKQSKDEAIPWKVFLHGQKEKELSECKNVFNTSGFIYCSGRVKYEMNNQTLRFILFQAGSYVKSQLALKNLESKGEYIVEPIIEIGLCSPL